MANCIYKLHNHIKHYEWGSADLIPRLMGIEVDDLPWAELWMGSHSGAPSRVSLPDGAPSVDGEISLGEFIDGELPFLLKLLAVEKPLSIQAHPNLIQAREGFERENGEGLAPDAPSRNYRDSNHKPEILCALSPFTGLCGFRPPEEIRRLLAVFSALREGFAPLVQALEIPDPSSALRDFFGELFSLSPEVRKALTEFILSARDESIEWELMRHFAQMYPGDPAIIAPLYLNVFRLEPGEAVFLKAGLLHAYIHGFAVELMANSDNVLRGGLTSKHIDIPELMKVLDFSPLKPQIIKPDPGLSCFAYPAPCEEFSLMVMRGTEKDSSLVFDRDYPSIGIVTEGEVSVGGTILEQGESAFIPPDKEPLVLRGNFTIYIATCCTAACRAGPQ